MNGGCKDLFFVKFEDTVTCSTSIHAKLVELGQSYYSCDTIPISVHTY